MDKSNDQYIFQAKELLRLISNTGQESYIVGEALRDLLLGREIGLVEIFTTLGQTNVLNLFKDYSPVIYNSYQTGITYQDYRFIISSAHQYELTYQIKINAVRRHYSTSLMDFLEKKMFAINTLAMGFNNVIYDTFNGRPGHEKKIRMICEKPSQLFIYEPERMLEAIRLVSELGMKLDKNVYRGISRRTKYIKNVPLDKASRELALIIEGKYAKKAIAILYKTKLYKKMPLFKMDIKRLYDRYHKIDGETFLALSLVRSKEYNEEVGSVLSDEYSFHMLVNLAITNPKGNYDVFTLFSNGEKACIKANNINAMLGRGKKKTGKIEKAYKALPVKKVCDLAFKGEDMIKLGISSDVNFIEVAIDAILEKVLTKKLPNEYEPLKQLTEKILKEYNETQKEASGKESAQEHDALDDKDFSHGLFSDSDFEEPVQSNLKGRDEELDKSLAEYEEFTKNQEVLERRVKELELDNLRKELELEINRKIKQNGMLDGLSGQLRNQTEEIIHKVYYDILINDDKYKDLKEADLNNKSNG